MREGNTSRHEAAIGVACVLLVHAVIGWGLHRLLRVEAARIPAELQVTWVEAVRRSPPIVHGARTRARVQLPVEMPAAPPAHEPAAPPAHEPTAPSRAPDTPASAPPSRPLSAVVVAQAQQWAQRQAPVATAGRDALADRRVPGLEAGDERFRMQAPRTVASVVDGIGQLFGAGPHPCAGHRDDVAGAATGGDAARLAMALEHDRRCRP